MKNIDNFHYKKSYYMSNHTLYMYYGMPKGTSQAKAMLNSEKIKSVPLAIVELG